MAVNWDPRRVLDLHPGAGYFTCVGTTLKGSRCGNSMISAAYQHEAAAILDSLPNPSRVRQDQAQLISTLRRLAFCTLCPRWHQGNKTKAGSQVNPVAQKWYSILLRCADEESPPARLYIPRLRQPILSPQPQLLPRNSEATTLSLTRPGSHSRRLLDAYPSPPPSRSPTPPNPYVSTREYSSRSIMSSVHGYPAYTSPQVSSTPSPPSTYPSNSSRYSSPRNVIVEVDVNASANIDNLRRRRVAALDAPSIRSISPSPLPSPPTSRRPSTSSLQHEAEVEGMRARIAMLEAQLAERSNSSSRSSTRSSSRAAEGFYRSRAPTPSSLPDPAMAPAVPQDFSIPSLPTSRQRRNNNSAADSIAAVSPRGYGATYTLDSPSAATPIVPQTYGNTTARPAMVHIVSPQSVRVPLDYALEAVSPSGMSTPVLISMPASPISIVSVNDTALSDRVRRRPIFNEPCYVCYERIVRPEDAVWCRSSCGQNLCVECFESWRTHTQEQERELTCGFCRAPWED